MGRGWDKFLGRRSPEDEAAYQELFMQFRQRFPDLEPIGQLPPLGRVNGIGLTVIGRRNADAGTSSYVKTLAVTVLFVPVFMPLPYRVVDAPKGGWYFIGKEPLSSFARAWNGLAILVIVALLVFIRKL